MIVNQLLNSLIASAISIIHRLVNDTFEINQPTTIGYMFMKKDLVLDSIPVRLDIYDTGE